jgi:hypothetical protein
MTLRAADALAVSSHDSGSRRLNLVRLRLEAKTPRPLTDGDTHGSRRGRSRPGIDSRHDGPCGLGRTDRRYERSRRVPFSS